MALIYNIWHTYKVSTVLSHVQRYETYHSLDTLCFWNIIYVDMMAILAFLVWIKIFKFISFNKTLVQFTTTLRRVSSNLYIFSYLCVLLLFHFSFLVFQGSGWLQSYVWYCLYSLCPIGSVIVRNKTSRFSQFYDFHIDYDTHDTWRLSIQSYRAGEPCAGAHLLSNLHSSGLLHSTGKR